MTQHAKALAAAQEFTAGMKAVSDRTGMPQLGDTNPIPVSAYAALLGFLNANVNGGVSIVMQLDQANVPWIGLGYPGETTETSTQMVMSVHIRADFMNAVKIDRVDGEPAKLTLNVEAVADIVAGALVSFLVAQPALLPSDEQGKFWIYTLDADRAECSPSLLPIALLSPRLVGEPIRMENVVNMREAFQAVAQRMTDFNTKLGELHALGSADGGKLTLVNVAGQPIR